jgi:hypothetical protein
MQHPSGDWPSGPTSKRGPYRRRLSHEIISTFHVACDLHDHAVAEALLDILDFMAARPAPGDKRRHEMDVLIAAHERRWHLRHPLFERADGLLVRT